MKRKVIIKKWLLMGLIFILVLSLLAGAACSRPGPAPAPPEMPPASESYTLSQVVLEVPTISCWTCQPRVTASAKSVPGVKTVEFDGQTVTVTYDPEQATPDTIVEAIEKGGDRVTKVIKLDRRL